ncbi:MAG: FKBP-type peptidyl-prolyl cis-trans isomerase [Paludibacteraceae bacterium]|nr:FKBP-type peptidyl-prolyl cis-trans isomerase [Paludibacteraceae bacterium]
MVIEDRKFVAVSYDLYVEGEDGKPELWESAPAAAPLKFTCGLGMMLEKFEDNLRGLKLGDSFDFTIPCAEAYGDYVEALVLDLDREIFMTDGEFDHEHVQEGKIVEMINADGQRVNGIVLEIGKSKVKVDFNHPLAGENLNFKGKVLELRDATEEEIAVVLHPHRCGGGCGSCGGCGGGSCGEGDCGGCGDGQCCH